MNQPIGAQTWNAARYAEQCRFVSDLGAPIVALLAPRPGERILDLGCGDGALTEKVAAAGATVVGVDASADMVAAARRRGLDARPMDGRRLQFAGEFDAVFSNAALHWMKDMTGVIAGVRRALKPGGRFVGEFGGFGNTAAVRTAIYAALDRRGIDAASVDPWYFPTADAWRGRLENAGFAVERAELIPRPTPLPTHMRDWLANFTESFFAAVPAADRGAAIADVERLLAPVLRDDAGRWTVDYVRLRFLARLPA